MGKTRGKGVKPAMEHLTMRVPSEVGDYFRTVSPQYTVEIRRVLVEYVEAKQAEGAAHGDATSQLAQLK